MGGVPRPRGGRAGLTKMRFMAPAPRALTWRSVLADLLAGEDLTTDATRWAMGQVMSGEASDIEVAGFLVALRAKGETVAEVRGLADVMVEQALPLRLDLGGRAVLDIVGTGGDGFDTVNISTMSSIAAAAAGVTVVKHGNRAASSRSGAADVIEALGVDLGLGPGDVARVGREVGITFCFAQTFHPSMRHAAPARRGLGVPTAFNLLGPITNPARPTVSVVGSARAEVMDLLAGVFAGRGTTAAVVRGREGLDEASTAGPTDVRWVSRAQVRSFTLEPEQVGVEHHPVEALRGGDAGHNAEVVREVMAGRPSPATEATVLNAGLALAAVDAGSLPEEVSQQDFTAHVARHVERVREVLSAGQAEEKLRQWGEVSRG